MWASLARGLPGKKPATHYQNHRFLGPTGAIPPVLSRDDHGAAYRAAGPLPPGCGAAPKHQRGVWHGFGGAAVHDAPLWGSEIPGAVVDRARQHLRLLQE